MSDKGKENHLKAHCNICGGEKQHRLLATHKVSDSQDVEELGTISWDYTYEMMVCLGCEHATFRLHSVFSESPEPKTEYFPPAVSRRQPVWREVPISIASLMDEVYVALHAGSHRLAMMGARALIDVAILETVGDVGNFQQKLTKMESDGYISRRNREVLNAALEVGNAASHRGHKATSEAVNIVMDIVENLLSAVYVLGPAAAQLKKVTPPRKPRT